MLTHEDTALLEGASALLKEARRQIGELTKEVDKLRVENKTLRRRNGDLTASRERAETDRRLLAERLRRPDALDTELWRDRAEFYAEQARILRLANASLATPPLRAGQGKENG